MTHQTDSPRMTPEQAAEYLGIASQTLAVWRCRRRYGLPYHRVGRLIRYSRTDLDAWLEERRQGGETAAAGELAMA